MLHKSFSSLFQFRYLRVQFLILKPLPDSNALVDSAESLKDHHSAVLNKVAQASTKEEVVDKHILAVTKLTLGAIKVKFDVEVLNEGGDGIPVGVGLFLDNLDQVLHYITPKMLTKRI